MCARIQFLLGGTGTQVMTPWTGVLVLAIGFCSLNTVDDTFVSRQRSGSHRRSRPVLDNREICEKRGLARVEMG